MENTLPGNAQIIDIKLNVDKRGMLSVIENNLLPFDIKRVFWIKDIPQWQTRGGHAIINCWETLIPIFGKFRMTLNDGQNISTIDLNNPNKGIIIPPNVWTLLHDFSQGAICMVLSSQNYNDCQYINSYNEFKKLISKK